LHAVGLSYLVDQLDVEAIGRCACPRRAAAARLRADLLARPEIVFLDEATSALDEAAEPRCTGWCAEADWHPTIVSVGHHGTLKRFHEGIIDLGRHRVSAAVAGN